MVIFRSAEGRPGYHQADDLDAAVRFVERLRNQESVTDARVFHMQEVPIEFRAYWKVEVAGVEVPAPAEPPAPALDAAPVEEAVSAPPEASPEGSVEASVEEPMAEPVPVASGRFGLFSRG